VSAWFVGMAALCAAAGPLWMLGLGLLSAALHELGHLAAMRVYDARALKICLTAAGVRIERAPGLSLNFTQEIAIAFAGPAVSLLLACLCFIVNRIAPLPPLSDCAALNLGFGLFNLLPVRQLDGGRALYFFLCGRVSEHSARRICLAASLLCLFALTMCAAYVCLNVGLNFSLIVAVVYLAACC